MVLFLRKPSKEKHKSRTLNFASDDTCSKRQANPSSSSTLEISLNVADFVLSALQDAASLAPVPFLSSAAGAALAILAAVQTTKGNIEDFQQLASDACKLVYVVLCRSRETDLPLDLQNGVQELITILHSIQQFSDKQVKRHLISRFIMYKSDLRKITEYRGRLRQCLDVYGLQSSLSIHENLARIITQQEKLVLDMKDRFDREEQDKLSRQDEKDEHEGHENGNSAGIVNQNSQPRMRVVRPSDVAQRGDERAYSTIDITPGHTDIKISKLVQDTPHFIVTTIAGDKNETINNCTTTNTNSGNTTTTTITGSYNDHSYRNFGGKHPFFGSITSDLRIEQDHTSFRQPHSRDRFRRQREYGRNLS